MSGEDEDKCCVSRLPPMPRCRLASCDFGGPRPGREAWMESCAGLPSVGLFGEPISRCAAYLGAWRLAGPPGEDGGA